jgi:hypothetical protein
MISQSEPQMMSFRITRIALTEYLAPTGWSTRTNKLFNNHTNPPQALPLLNRPLSIHNLLQTRLHIHLLRIPRPLILPEHNPMNHIHHNKDGNPNIRRQEPTCTPVLREEDREAVRQAEEREHDDRDVGAIRLDPGMVGRFDSLGGAGFAEAEVDDAAADPGDHAPGVGEVDEPGEDCGAAGGDVEVGEAGEKGGYGDRVLW